MKIFIDNNIVDYDEANLVSFVYSIEQDSGRTSGAHSKRTLKLPKTKINDLVFNQ